MTSVRSRQIVAAAAGLSALMIAAPASSDGPFSIAPFQMRAKQKIYTFYYPTLSGYTFLGSRLYVPPAQFNSTGTSSGYPGKLGGPVVAHVASGKYYVSYYYGLNPYWGAHHSPGISAGQAAAGTNPTITLHPGVARLGANAPPDFTVATGQIQVTARDYLLTAGPYFGFSYAFDVTNGHFQVGHGLGPVGPASSSATQKTFTAFPNVSSAGRVRFTKGTDNVGGFGGTLAFLGGTVGYYNEGYVQSRCAPEAFDCYHQRLHYFPALRGAAGEQNQWVGLQSKLIINYFTVTTGEEQVVSTTTTKTGTVTSVWTTFRATTGRVVVSQSGGSFPTIQTTTGSDNRSPNGMGNITLVTGWLGHTFTTTGTSHWGGYNVFRFEFGAAQATPSLASPVLGLLASLLAIAGLYGVRRRRGVARS